MGFDYGLTLTVRINELMPEQNHHEAQIASTYTKHTSHTSITKPTIWKFHIFHQEAPLFSAFSFKNSVKKNRKKYA
jgi:hypothetical protein